jgi:hypothetical protein
MPDDDEQNKQLPLVTELKNCKCESDKIYGALQPKMRVTYTSKEF